MEKETREIPPDQALLDWSGEHLAHEVFMFQQSVETLYRNQYKQEIHTYEKQARRGIPLARERYKIAVLLHNALIDSFTIHFRCLHEFFYEPVPTFHKKFLDARASDFYDEPSQWDRVRPPKDALWDVTEDRVSKLTAHLSYKRMEIDKHWNWTPIYQTVAEVVAAFVGTASRRKLASNITEIPDLPKDPGSIA